MDAAHARIWVDSRLSIFRSGLVDCLRSGGQRVEGESSLLEPSPDLGRVDVLLFDLEGLAAIDVGAQPGVALIALVAAVEDGMAALEAGLDGYLVRPDLEPGELFLALDSVLSGGRWYPGLRVRHRVGRLGVRELAVLRLLADGGRTDEIARELSYSERTVKNIVHDVLNKTDCRTRAHAVAVVMRNGLI